MVKNPQQYKEPIIRVTVVVVSGNGYGGPRLSPSGRLFVYLLGFITKIKNNKT